MQNFIKKYGEIIRYLIIGVLTTIISLVVYYSLTYTILNPNKALELQIANVISWIISVTFAYFTNRQFVFQKKDKYNLKEMISFYLSRIGTLLIDMFLMYLLVSIFKFNDKIIKVLVQVIVIILNYIFSKFIVFKKM